MYNKKYVLLVYAYKGNKVEQFRLALISHGILLVAFREKLNSLNWCVSEVLGIHLVQEAAKVDVLTKCCKETAVIFWHMAPNLPCKFSNQNVVVTGKNFRKELQIFGKRLCGYVQVNENILIGIEHQLFKRGLCHNSQGWC